VPSKFLYGVIVAGFAALVYAFAVQAPVANAGELENLQIFPKNTSKKDMKKAMKKISKALGVECEYCHDMDDMAKDTKPKKISRSMMRMTNQLNQKFFKGKHRITCVTCHDGQKEPK